MKGKEEEERHAGSCTTCHGGLNGWKVVHGCWCFEREFFLGSVGVSAG